MKNQIHVAYFLFPFRSKNKNGIQKRAFLLPFFKKQIQTSFFLFLKETKKELCIPFSFFWRKHKKNSERWIPFSFFWRKHKGNCKSCNPYSLFPFWRKHKKKFGMMDSFFLFSHKSKTGNWICLHPPGSLIPRLSPHTNRPRNKTTLQEYPVALAVVTFDLKIFHVYIHWLVVD